MTVGGVIFGLLIIPIFNDPEFRGSLVAAEMTGLVLGGTVLANLCDKLVAVWADEADDDGEAVAAGVGGEIEDERDGDVDAIPKFGDLELKSKKIYNFYVFKNILAPIK